MTAHSLKIKYALTALGICTGIAIVIAALLFWQYRATTQRLTTQTRNALTQELERTLERRGHDLAESMGQRLQPLMMEKDWAAAHAAAGEMLKEAGVQGLELRDAKDAVLFSVAEPAAQGASPPLQTRKEVTVSIPGREVRKLGSLIVSMSRADADRTLFELNRELTQQQQTEKRELIMMLAGAGILLVVCALLTAWLMGRRLQRPISALIKSAERIGQGDYTRPMPVIRKDELGELQEALERMRLKLRQTTITKNYLNIVLNSMTDAVLVTSPDGTVKGINDAARKLFGYSEEELTGKSILHIIDEKEHGNFSIEQAAQDTRETVIRTRSGQTIPVSLSGSTIDTEDPQFQGNIFLARNITDRKRAERRIRYLARYDTLTKIPNRMQFQHLLQQALARAARSGQQVALLYLDMDRFKEVNDTFGHSAGDRTLEILTERLVNALPRETVLGRLAGDEFALFLENLPPGDNRGPVSGLARTILEDISKTFHLEQQEVFLTASIGVAFCPQDAENTIDLIRNADAAMYYSKQNGGNSFAFYSREMNAAAVERLMLKSKLRRSLEREELVILYQPKVDLRDGRIVGAEALLRWRLPGHGDIPPSQFIPLAEETSLILDIGQWVLNKVCSDYRSWQTQVSLPGRISINLSLKQLRQASFITRFKSIFKKHEVSPTCFELEITETTLMSDAKRTLKLLDELYAMGLHLSIDDFGTGYSSLSALQQFPIGTLKIDQSFVRDAAVNKDDATLVRTIIEMGRSLEMDVVAEGVETEEQLEFLRKHNCNYAQGRLFGEPVKAEVFLGMLAAQHAGNSNIVKLFG